MWPFLIFSFFRVSNRLVYSLSPNNFRLDSIHLCVLWHLIFDRLDVLRKDLLIAPSLVAVRLVQVVAHV